MNVELCQYQNAVDCFVGDMRTLGPDLIGIVLYGSLARGDVRPGQSDILDAYVYLRREALENRERFMKTLEVMVAACNRLRESGIPFHPFHYFCEDEMGTLPAVYLASWRSSESSAVLEGEDIRSKIDSTEISRAVARLSFFNARRTMGHFLCQYLKRHFDREEGQAIVKALISLKKNLIPIACLVLDIWTTSEESVRELEIAFPGIDMNPLHRIESLRRSTERPDPDQIRDVIRQTMIFIEDLHDKLLQYSKQDQSHVLSKAMTLVGIPGSLIDS
jgi:hypothetical protein